MSFKKSKICKCANDQEVCLKWCVVVPVQQRLQMVSCLSDTFSSSSSDGETKIVPHVRFKTRRSIRSLTHFVSPFPTPSLCYEPRISEPTVKGRWSLS